VEETEEKRLIRNFKIVGFNLLVLVGYTILCGFIRSVAALYLDALLLAVHAFFCFMVTVFKQKWIWLLSAFVVLLIGSSTCIGILSKF